MASLLRTVGGDDNRQHRPRDGGISPRPREVYSPGPHFRQTCLFAVERQLIFTSSYASDGIDRVIITGGETDISAN